MKREAITSVRGAVYGHAYVCTHTQHTHTHTNIVLYSYTRTPIHTHAHALTLTSVRGSVYGHTYVCALECRGVVHTVAGHASLVAQLA
jgi:hypothetical protein